MKCSSCNFMADSFGSAGGRCPNCGSLPIPGQQKGVSEHPASGSKHEYQTAYGKFTGLRQKTGIWAVVYQLQPENDRADAVASVIRNQATAMSKLRHASLAQLHSAGEREQRLVWALPNLPSLVPLSLFDSVLDINEVTTIIRSLAGAVGMLHQAGVAAFDLSPSLIFVGPGFHDVILVPTLPLASQILWSPGKTEHFQFVAPELEQTRHQAPDPMRADQFGLGALAWYLLTRTNRKRFRIKLPSDHSPDFANWDAFIDGACRSRPERRFGSIREAFDSLTPVATSSAIGSANDLILPVQNATFSRQSGSVQPVSTQSKTSTSIAPRATLAARSAAFRSRKRQGLRWTMAIVAIIIAIGVYVRREDFAAVIPGLGGFVTEYKRGFGDTIVKYRDRSYDGAAWKKVQGSESLSIMASLGTQNSGATFWRIAGWDDDHYWVAESDGSVFRFQNKSWTFLGQCQNGDYPVPAVLNQDQLLLLGGQHRSHLYELSPAGTVDYGELGWHGGRDLRLLPVAPDLFYAFSSGGSLAKISDGKLSQMPEDKFKESFVHKTDNTPLKEFLVKRITNTQTYGEGKAIGLVDPIHGNGKRKIVSFQNGVWYELEELTEKKDFTNCWLACDGDSPTSLVLVGEHGHVLAHTIKGKSIQQSVTSAQEKTSLNLINVWGVNLEKYWVLDESGTVWERHGTDSRVVVRGLYRDDVKFRQAWVSPRGSVYAITEHDLYCLE
jgi:hypothetical protein